MVLVLNFSSEQTEAYLEDVRLGRNFQLLPNWRFAVVDISWTAQSTLAGQVVWSNSTGTMVNTVGLAAGTSSPQYRFDPPRFSPFGGVPVINTNDATGQVFIGGYTTQRVR